MIFNWFRWQPERSLASCLDKNVWLSWSKPQVRCNPILPEGWKFDLTIDYYLDLDDNFKRVTPRMPRRYVFRFFNDVGWSYTDCAIPELFEEHGFWFCLDIIWPNALNEMMKERTKTSWRKDG